MLKNKKGKATKGKSLPRLSRDKMAKYPIGRLDVGKEKRLIFMSFRIWIVSHRIIPSRTSCSIKEAD